MTTVQWDADENKRISPSSQPDIDQLLELNPREIKEIDTEGAVSEEKNTKQQQHSSSKGFSFAGLPLGVDSTHHVAEGYRADILIRWGDPVTDDAPEFDPMGQTPDSQVRQFGYNNDFAGFFSLPRGSHNPDRGLLAVNHEYTSRKLMFPLYENSKQSVGRSDYERSLCEIEMAAHGISVIEIEKNRAGHWQRVRFSPYNRRISPLKSVLDISGPAAGHQRLKTSYDPKGRHVIGTLNNCAGDITPWGTLLTTEENFNGYFTGSRQYHPEKEKLERYGIPGGWLDWGKYHDRFDIEKEPNEVNRFGWMVELDPYDPHARPVKRTALGRFKHEGAAIVVNKDGRVVVYSADDQNGEYLYKFVSHGRYNPLSRRTNFDLLDDGALYVARFGESGGLDWLPLRQGVHPLTVENGFVSQADVVIDARFAADLLGATPLNRPEDVTVNPKNSSVYLMLLADAAHPAQGDGKVLQLIPPEADHTRDHFNWQVMLRTGRSSEGVASGQVAAEGGLAAIDETGGDSSFFAPDNFAVDGLGRLWVTTDHGKGRSKAESTDGIWAVETEGENRGQARMFFRVPVAAEVASPAFTPDDRTLFVSVQHPGCDEANNYPPFSRASTFDDPATRWPDFKPDVPPRPSLVVITKKSGGVVGS